jgi:hypothetical protein
MTKYLAGLDEIRFEAEIRYDTLQTTGQLLEFGSHRSLAIRRSGQARIEVDHGHGTRELLVYDGALLSLTIPRLGVYASVEQRGSVSEVFDYLVTEVGTASPLTDLLHPDLHQEVAQRVSSGMHLGTALVSSVRCDHLVFRSERVDFELFVEQGERPLPIRLVIRYREEAGAPGFRATLHDWQTAPEFSDSLFRFEAPIGLQRVPFDELLDLLLGLRESEGDAEGVTP